MAQKRVFLSYSHHDQAFMERLLLFFAPVLRRELFELWVDREIQPGARWFDQLRASLEAADLAILLVSPHYLASDFIQRHEFLPLLNAANQGRTKIFWIPITESAVKHTELIDFQAAHDPACPLDKLDASELNSAFGVILDCLLVQLELDPEQIAERRRNAQGEPRAAGAGTAAGAAGEAEAGVPEPGSLPPHSMMPYSANPLFCGRTAELQRLAEMLAHNPLAVIGQRHRGVATTGLGGIGKTQLAVEFAWRYGHKYSGGVFWLHCADPSSVGPQLARVGAALGLHADYERLTPEQQLALSERALAGPEPRLLILDNCEDEALLERWRPSQGGCRVLLTSRRASWNPQLGIGELALNALARGESIKLLQALCPRLSAADADPLAELLGDLPLALHLAGCYQARYFDSIPAPQFLAELRTKQLAHEAFAAANPLPGHLEQLPTHHQRALAATFAQSWDALDQSASDSAARRLLARAALLAPSEPIPRALLLSLLEAEPKTRADGLTRLLDLGLLSSETAESVSIHRLIAAFASSRSQEAQPELVQELGEKLKEQANTITNAGLPKPLIAWRAHLAELAEHAEKQKLGIFVSLANSLGGHWCQVAEWRQAENWYRRGLAKAESTPEAKDPLLDVLLNNLAQLLQDTNRLAEAELLMRRALAIDEASFGADFHT